MAAPKHGEMEEEMRILMKTKRKESEQQDIRTFDTEFQRWEAGTGKDNRNNKSWAVRQRRQGQVARCYGPHRQLEYKRRGLTFDKRIACRISAA